MPPLLELSGITKTFGGVAALRAGDFSLQNGEIHGLVGVAVEPETGRECRHGAMLEAKPLRTKGRSTLLATSEGKWGSG